MSLAATSTDGGTTQFSQLLARYERIIEISQQLNSTLDQTILLRKIISASIELTNTEAASILLLDPATGELRFEYASNIKPHEMEKIVVPMEGSIAGWVVTHGEARVIQDVSREPQFFKNVDDTIQFKTRNLLAVPMRTHHKVIGALEAVNKLNGERFNDDDIKTLLTLAGQAAIAIENTRLFQQSDFMAEMVHELRTPLAALKTSTTLLLRTDLPEDRRQDMIITMQSETERLIRMTTEFLDLARWESGRVQLESAPFALMKLLAECFDVITSQAADRSVTISIEGDDFVISGDRGKIKQVLLNLLTNSIKYNRDGGQVVVYANATANQGDPFVQIAVADTGHGISKDAQKNMFQKFYRVADTAGYTQGTGLGLAITKHIVEAHNGEIWLESEKDVGSTFFLTLPLAD
jgi:signal transduction histidine kinase